MNQPHDTFKDKNILIFGLGLQGGGLGDTQYLIENQYNTRITDLKTEQELSAVLESIPNTIQKTLGKHDNKDIDWADIIIKNPGVPEEIDYIQYAKQQNKTIINSTALFVKHSAIPVIGVTGTRGKTTTATLIHEILNSQFPGEVILGGNIPGTSGLQLFNQQKEKKHAVLELSSFQLAGFHTLQTSPHIAVVTNIYDDHMDRYQSQQQYIHDKEAITQYQSSEDHLIINKENIPENTFTNKTKAKIHTYLITDVPRNIKTLLLGNHNLENIASALKVSEVLGILRDSAIKTISTFKSVPNRLQTIAEINGIEYINDTTSTTPIATIKAIKAMKKPTTLILGGASKQINIDEMIREIATNNIVRHVIILGSQNNKELNKHMDTISNKISETVTSMHKAVETATKNTKPGEVVLLSPGFFSFDLFNNEFDRGDQFNEEVKQLKKHTNNN